MTEPTLDSLMGRMASAHVKAGKLPPVNDWHPTRQYRIKIRIDREGRWYYLDSEIKRHSMVCLFASILRHDSDGYYLVTPQEKLLIKVDCQPLVATRVEVVSADPRQLVFSINTGEMVTAGPEHRLEVTEVEGQPQPCIHVRDNLYALVHRNVFYQLVAMADEQSDDTGTSLVVDSLGQHFSLGHI